MSEQSADNGNPKNIDLPRLKQAVERQPNNAKAWLDYAIGEAECGDLSNALLHFQRTMSIGVDSLTDIDKCRMYVQLGRTTMGLKRFRDAGTYLREAVEKLPSAGAIKIYLAICEYRLWRGPESLRLLIEMALAHPPDPSVAEFRELISHDLQLLD